MNWQHSIRSHMLELKMEGNDKAPTKKYKNKVKSRYKRMLKKYKKSGIDNATKNSESYKYLMRIMDVIDNVRNDEYEMGILSENVFGEIKGSEVLYAKWQVTSKLLQELLPYSNDKDFVEFVEPFTANLRPIFMDKVASHIMQSIITECFQRYRKVLTESGSNDKQSVTLIEIILKIAGFSLNNLDNFIWESSSNHIIRTILNVLSGHTVINNISSYLKAETPSEFQVILIKFANAIINHSQFQDFCYTTVTSGLLQTLSVAIKDIENGNKALIKKVLKQNANQQPIDLRDEKNEPFLRLLEVILEVSDMKQFKKIYKTFFGENLKELAVSKSGNFAVQKLVKNCEDKELFETLFDELNQAGEDILVMRYTGVLLELAQGCLHFKTKQGEFVKLMLRILKCQKTLNEDSDIAPLTCCMVTSDKFDPDLMKINLHGTLIVQAMLNFGKPIKIINSLLNMETKYLLEIISDPRGCHIVDAFIQSPTVGEKSRDRLFKKLLGSYLQLATSKHGSRSLDAIWSGITTKSRVILMEELKENESELTANQFGKLFASKNFLYNFRRNRDEWIKRDRTLETTKKCFADIVPVKKPKL